MFHTTCDGSSFYSPSLSWYDALHTINVHENPLACLSLDTPVNFVHSDQIKNSGSNQKLMRTSSPLWKYFFSSQKDHSISDLWKCTKPFLGIFIILCKLLIGSSPYIFSHGGLHLSTPLLYSKVNRGMHVFLKWSILCWNGCPVVISSDGKSLVGLELSLESWSLTFNSKTSESSHTPS